MLPTTLTSLVVPLLHSLLFNRPYGFIPHPPPRLNFELRHLHTVSPYGHVLFSDVSHQTLHAQFNGQNRNNSYTVPTRMISSSKPSSFTAFSHARTRSIKFSQSEQLQWDEEEIIAPDVESREALLELAKMTNNAYIERDDPDWYDLGGDWNNVCCCPKTSSLTSN